MSPKVTKADLEQALALALIKSGRVTMSEAAMLRKVSKQYMHKAARGFNPRAAREKYVRNLWRKMLNGKHRSEPLLG